MKPINVYVEQITRISATVLAFVLLNLWLASYWVEIQYFEYDSYPCGHEPIKAITQLKGGVILRKAITEESEILKIGGRYGHVHGSPTKQTFWTIRTHSKPKPWYGFWNFGHSEKARNPQLIESFYSTGIQFSNLVYGPVEKVTKTDTVTEFSIWPILAPIWICVLWLWFWFRKRQNRTVDSARGMVPFNRARRICQFIRFPIFRHLFRR